MRWRKSWTSSTGETCLVLMRSIRSAAELNARFWLGMVGVGINVVWMSKGYGLNR